MDSLANNHLAGETDYVNKDEVQGESFEVGAKVMYNGCQMTVSQAPDEDGDLKMLDFSAVFALCDALPQMKALEEIKCAAMHCYIVTPRLPNRIPNMEYDTRPYPVW